MLKPRSRSCLMPDDEEARVERVTPITIWE
jgi:hypothetical protein